MAWLCSCGYEAGDWDVLCSKCRSARPIETTASQVRNVRLESVTDRYTDSFSAAKSIIDFGGVVKILGGCAAVLIILVGLSVSNAHDSTPLLWVGVLFGLVAWIFLWAFGVLISAQGHQLKASIDGAVNTSPFLSDEQRAKIMSLQS
jgi:hypothetical protein